MVMAHTLAITTRHARTANGKVVIYNFSITDHEQGCDGLGFRRISILRHLASGHFQDAILNTLQYI